MNSGNGQLEPYDLGSIKPWAVPFILDGENYLLREPSEGAVTEYRRSTMKSISFDQAEGKVTGVEGSADAEPQLVSACFFQVKVNASGNPTEIQVTERELRSWPGRIASKLFDVIKERCPYLMGEETEEGLTKDKARIEKRLEKLKKAREKGEPVIGSAKNSLSPTTTT